MTLFEWPPARSAIRGPAAEGAGRPSGRVTEGPAPESPLGTVGCVVIGVRSSKRRPGRAVERAGVLAHAREAPRRLARSASRAREGAARRAMQPKCGIAGTARAERRTGRGVSARQARGLAIRWSLGTTRGCRATKVRAGWRRRVSVEIHAGRSSALGLPVGHFHDGGPRDGAARPTATGQAHRQQSDHQHRPERAWHPPCLLVPRPMGRRSDF